MDKKEFFDYYSNNTYSDYKCNMCKNSNDENLTFYNYSWGTKYYFRFCKNCLMLLNSNDILEIYDQIKSESFFGKSCDICHNSMDEFFYIEKGFGKPICIDCLCEIFDTDETDYDDGDEIDTYPENKIIIIFNNNHISKDTINKTLSKINNKFLSIKFDIDYYNKEILNRGHYNVIQSNEIEIINYSKDILESNNINYEIYDESEYKEKYKLYHIVLFKKRIENISYAKSILIDICSSYDIEFIPENFDSDIYMHGYYILHSYYNVEDAEYIWEVLRSLNIKSKILNDDELEDYNEKNI